jgi:hypothetical protein
LQSDVADARVREQFQYRFDHPETGAQDGNHDDVGSQRLAIGPLERSLHPDIRAGQLTSGFHGQHQADSMRETAKMARGRGLVPERDQRVERDRMLDQMHRHEGTI